MLKKLTCFVLALIFAVPVVVTSGVRVYADEQPEPRPEFNFIFELVAENDYARMYLDARNNNIRVVNIASGQHFDTLVFNGQQGNPLTREIQRSDFELSIIRDVTRGNTMVERSFTESVARRQVEYTFVDGGVHAQFTIGDPEMLHITMFPRFISVERMYELVFDPGGRQVRDFILGLGTGVGATSHYTLLDGRFVRNTMTRDHATGEFTVMGLPTMRRLWAAFYEDGNYSFEELDYDNEYWQYEPFVPPMMTELGIVYTLDGPDLIVTVPRENMVFLETNPFRSIVLHPYLMSGCTAEQGYLFVPDGSGGIIHFNNGMSTEELRMPVFGDDLLLEGWNYREFFDQATLPIFGMVRGDMGILAIIEEGAPVATIRANTSGRIDEFNRVFAEFDLSFFEGLLNRGSGAMNTTMQHMDVYDMDIRMRYIFLSGEDASYVGMARIYREYLMAQGAFRTNPVPEEAPFFVNFYATAPRNDMFWGLIPYTQHFPMTTTENAINILDAMQSQGINNIHAQFSHWTNGGMMASPLDRLRPQRSIGGRRGMENLEAHTREIGVELYPAVRAMSFVGGMVSRFGRTNRSMLARNLGNMAQTESWRVMASRINAGGAFLLSPQYLLGYVGRILNNFANMGFRNIAVFDLGRILVGNYGRGRQITRLEAVEYVRESLRELSADTGLMLRNPNSYAFEFASSISDLPFNSVGRRIVDQNVPFVQMVLENHIPHSMPAFNLDVMAWRGFQEYMLRAVESRSAMQLLLTYQNEVEFQPTFMSFWFLNVPPLMTQWSRWEDTLGDYYARYNYFYQAVRGAYTAHREVLDGGDRIITTYTNGVRVYINYSSNVWNINGMEIPPLDFEVVR